MGENTTGLVAALHAFSTLDFYSFMGDWVMWKDMLVGRIRF